MQSMILSERQMEQNNYSWTRGRGSKWVNTQCIWVVHTDLLIAGHCGFITCPRLNVWEIQRLVKPGYQWEQSSFRHLFILTECHSLPLLQMVIDLYRLIYFIVIWLEDVWVCIAALVKSHNVYLPKSFRSPACIVPARLFGLLGSPVPWGKTGRFRPMIYPHPLLNCQSSSLFLSCHLFCPTFCPLALFSSLFCVWSLSQLQ